MIDELLVSAARKKLSELSGDVWDRVDSEIQDDGSFVLFMARIAWGEAKEVAPELRRAVAITLNSMVPPHPSQELGSWMVNVYYGAALVDAIFPNEL